MLLLEPWKQVTALLQHQQSGVLLVATCDRLWEKIFFESISCAVFVSCYSNVKVHVSLNKIQGVSSSILRLATCDVLPQCETRLRDILCYIKSPSNLRVPNQCNILSTARVKPSINNRADISQYRRSQICPGCCPK
jgi:hypothetical protein